ncbi:hypothetical protein AURDEDRAFT_177590 [Auricularia subglabra TFB-10046 SS5]|uniref:F-box domain-containing protein n=1 Tax=Auricularia subglabra (strain TFB-10046 / SS5) TaxID=717982 RepID=J0LA97_AURST|nr:hypothetical protein AURDEDRAFT_177590 [Auricularia subglabra TFB-10046 SS5]
MVQTGTCLFAGSSSLSTSRGRDMTPRLNVVLLPIVFDTVDLPTLCRSSHISHSWHEAARNHPTYRKRLSFDSQSISGGDVELFLDRLTAKGGADAKISLAL